MPRFVKKLNETVSDNIELSTSCGDTCSQGIVYGTPVELYIIPTTPTHPHISVYYTVTYMYIFYMYVYVM